MTLLLIDDDIHSVTPLLQILENHVHEPFIHFRSGSEAIQHLRSVQKNTPFSLACVSLTLKDMHGYALCTLLQRHPLCAHTPIIVLGDNDNHHNVNHLSTLGISDIFTRPFNMPHIPLRVAMAVKLAKETQQRILYERKLAGLDTDSFEDVAESFIHPLSSLPNRIALQHYVRQFNHNNAIPLSFITLAIDSYEEYVEAYGVEAGQALCKDISQVLISTSGPLGSALCHYDTHVFAIMMPATSLDDAVTFANAIRKNIEGLTIEHRESRCADIVTLSAGVGRTENTAYTPVNALATAFLNMERAMRFGGNHVLSSIGYF